MPLAIDTRGQRKGPVMGEALPDDVFVIDAIVHAYNLDPSNARNKYGLQLGDLITGIHTSWNPPGMALSADSFRADTSIEAVVRAVFEESQTAMAVTHVLRLDSWFHDGLSAFHKTHEAVRRWPNRMIGYVGVDPLAPREVYLDDLRRQVDQMPGAVGLKLYPHAVDAYRRWRADDDDIMALFELAMNLGLKSVAIHKAVPNGAVPLDPYRVDDIDLAADAFPDLAFEIVHSGMAFLEETAWAIGRYPNVYANLEITTMLLHRAPGWFEEILAQLLFWGGPQKILWSTGAVLVHPQPILERFWALQFSERVLEKFGLEQLTREDKELILGRNYAAMIDLDLPSARAAVQGDEFALHRAEHGLSRPYSSWPVSPEG
jgi:uncharacterized protein